MLPILPLHLDRPMRPLWAAFVVFLLAGVAAATLIWRAEPLEFWFSAALGLLFSLLLAYVAKLLLETRAHEQNLQALLAERKQSEQALRENVQQLRLFTDNVPVMTAAFDKDLHLVFVNKRYVEFFGHGKTDLLGQHLREVVGQRTFSEIEGYFVQVLQ